MVKKNTEGEFTYLSRNGLINLNKEAIRRNTNRSVVPEILEKETKEGTLYPVVYTMIHNDTEVRAQIAVGKYDENTQTASGVTTVWIDTPIEVYERHVMTSDKPTKYDG